MVISRCSDTPCYVSICTVRVSRGQGTGTGVSVSIYPYRATVASWSLLEQRPSPRTVPQRGNGGVRPRDLCSARAPTARYPTAPMAPRPTRPSQDSIASKSANNELDRQLSPTWDSSPNTMPGMLQAVHRFLPRANPDYRNLVEYGIIAGSRKTIWVHVAWTPVRSRGGVEGW